jgi:hypothetical protein
MCATPVTFRVEFKSAGSRMIEEVDIDENVFLHTRAAVDGSQCIGVLELVSGVMTIEGEELAPPVSVGWCPLPLFGAVRPPVDGDDVDPDDFPLKGVRGEWADSHFCCAQV